MKKLAASLFLALAAVLPAHEDRIGPLVQVQKVSAVPKPIGRTTLTWDAGAGETPAPSLKLQCDLFAAAVPANGLADLPRPDFNPMHVAWSLTSFGPERKWVDRPYLYVVIPLHGPAGQAWEQTWVTFHFDDKGAMTRKFKRFVRAGENSVSVFWKDWPVGGGVSAEDLYKASEKSGR